MTVNVSWQDFWSDAKSVDIVDAATRLGARFKKQGRELTSACPAGCAKTDGFVVFPEKGTFFCRPSGAGGDVIEMVAHCQGCDRVEAAEKLLERDRPKGGVSAPLDPRAKLEAERRRAMDKDEADKRAARRARLEAAKKVRDGEAIASIMERAVAFHGTHAEAYLRERGAPLSRNMTRDLRFVDELHYWGYADAEADEKTLLCSLPAMVAVIRALNGDQVGVHITYLDEREPRKWVAPWEKDLPAKRRRNDAKKFRTATEQLYGSMIRLGAITDTVVLGEGIETVGNYWRMGFAPEDASFGVAMSLDNLAGGAVSQRPHPTVKMPDGRPAWIRNGYPDPAKPNVLLPPHAKRVILLGDGDSDKDMTEAALLTGARRYKAEGREVVVHMADPGCDFADMGARK